MKKLTTATLFISILAYYACDDKNLEPVTKTDADNVDAADQDFIGDEVFEEDSEEIQEEEEIEIPEHCSGSDTLRLEFKDDDGNLLEGVHVALKCLNDQFETNTNENGIASFGNLDLAAFPVDITGVHEKSAYTLTDIGGSRTVPDPLPIFLWLEEYVVDPVPDTVRMQGNIIRNQPGSWVLMSIGEYTQIADDNDETYSFNLIPATNLPLSAIEYTLEDEVATPIAFSLIRFDVPGEGEPGPDVAPIPVTFHTASLEVVFDLRADSPLNDARQSFLDFRDGFVLDSRDRCGIQIIASDNDDGCWREHWLNCWRGGLTTSWTPGASSHTLEVAWVEEAVAGAPLVENYLYIYGSNILSSSAWANLPDNPETWSPVIIHDAPDIIERSFEEYPDIVFEEDLSIRIPAGVQLVRYNLDAVLEEERHHWLIETPSERTIMNFSKLPWPHAVDQIEFLGRHPGIGGLTLTMQGSSFDVDLFDSYVYWTNEDLTSDPYYILASQGWYTMLDPEP